MRCARWCPGRCARGPRLPAPPACLPQVLYVRPDAKFDKSKGISGGIPHCFPQAGACWRCAGAAHGRWVPGRLAEARCCPAVRPRTHPAAWLCQELRLGDRQHGRRPAAGRARPRGGAGAHRQRVHAQDLVRPAPILLGTRYARPPADLLARGGTLRGDCGAFRLPVHARAAHRGCRAGRTPSRPSTRCPCTARPCAQTSGYSTRAMRPWSSPRPCTPTSRRAAAALRSCGGPTMHG